MEISGISSPNEILERLEQLQKWQEEQKNQLVQKQLAQRHQLQLEQQKLCEMFGLSGSITINDDDGSITNISSRFADHSNNAAATSDDITNNSSIYDDHQSNQNEEEIIENTDLKNNSIDENIPLIKVPIEYLQVLDNKSPLSELQCTATINQKVDEPIVCKRKFLRRGEGRLNNLPIYKISKIHQSLKFSEKSKSKCRNKQPSNDVLCLKKTNTKKVPKNDEQIQQSDSICSFLRAEEFANQQETPLKMNTKVKPTGHVYFADEVIVNESPLVKFCGDADDVDQEEIDYNEDALSSENELLTNDFMINKTSTPNTKTSTLLESIPTNKNLLRQIMMTKVDGTVPQLSTTSDSSVQKIDCDNFKEKLEILENEIKIYREQNAQLTHSKQLHELEKSKFEEEQNEFHEKMEDERIKLEVYLHDERIKLADERTTLERRLKDSKGPNRKEREDMTKLKEQINNLESDLLSKQQQHIAAQARLRAKLRTMEKDFKDLSIEMETLKKENKKCEQENIRLRRQGNNKILNEINRNIAKLGIGATSSVGETIRNSESPQNQQQKIANKLETNLSKSKSIDNNGKATKIKSTNYENHELSIDNNYVERSNDCNDEIDEKNKFFSSDQYNQDKMEKKVLTAGEQQEEQMIKPVATLQKQLQHNQQTWKREVQNEDGSKDYWYPNGNIKKISTDSMVIRMLYYNKDIKETNFNEGTVKYYYAESNTWHTSYLDGLEIFEFPNGQTEHRYKDGKIEIHFPNGLVRISTPKSEDTIEQWTYPNGQQMIQKRNGEKILIFSNGQREIHTETHKRREYPDGTVKFVYLDGSQETRYSNGRIRLKDSAGNLVMDSENLFVEK